ncbi:hypothetical protein B9K09_12230 [Pseudomonas sp. M30-35]|nr:hypothetical protein B9K09_12230 [Pseudomonas sp. M30-35]
MAIFDLTPTSLPCINHHSSGHSLTFAHLNVARPNNEEPITGLGHNSMVYMIGSQIQYVLGALNLLKKTNLQSLEVKREVQDAFNHKLQIPSASGAK